MSSVGVVVPCYNYGHFLREAVSSILSDQPGVDVRVLIIDDASTDGSAAVARTIAAADERVDVVEHKTNRGHIATYNEGLLEWADADYTVLMSADDRLTPGALTRAAELLDAHPEVGFVYGHPIRFSDGTPPPPARTRLKGWSIWPGQWWLERRFHDAVSCISSPEVVVRTSLQRKVGGYDARLPHTGDIEMWLRLAAQGDVGYIKGADQAFYRLHSRNMTHSRTRLIDLKQRRLAYESVLDKCAGMLSAPDHLSDLLHRRLSWEALWTAARAYDRNRVAQTPMDELVAFAFDCWPRADRMPVYYGLKFREVMGPHLMPYLQPLIWTAVGRHAQNWWWWQSWARRGY